MSRFIIIDCYEDLYIPDEATQIGHPPTDIKVESCDPRNPFDVQKKLLRALSRLQKAGSAEVRVVYDSLSDFLAIADPEMVVSYLRRSIVWEETFNIKALYLVWPHLMTEPLSDEYLSWFGNSTLWLHDKGNYFQASLEGVENRPISFPINADLQIIDMTKFAVDKARAIPLPSDREILHLLPQEFILDEQDGIHDPLGMMATRLETRVHIVTASSSAIQNVVTAVNRAGVHVDDTVFEPLAGADAVLRADERELGVCFADLGAGSSNLIVFKDSAVAHTAAIPVGGDHFTSDLSVGLCTPLAEAEKVKKFYGHAIVTMIPEGNEVEVPFVGDRPSHMVSQRTVGEILEPRARELFEMLRDNLRHAGMFEACSAGIVLSGGASRLPGIIDVADSVLRRPVRLSWPAPLSKMPALLAEPEYATAIGMIFYAHRARMARGIQNDGWSSRLKAMLVGKGA